MQLDVDMSPPAFSDTIPSLTGVYTGVYLDPLDHNDFDLTACITVYYELKLHFLPW